MGEAYLDMVSLLLTWPVPVHGDAMKPMLVFHSWLPRTILPWFWSPCISIDSLQERSREGQKLDMYNTLHCWRCVPKLTLDHASEVWDGTPQSQFRLIAKTCVWFGIKSWPPGSEAEERLQILLQQHLKSQAVARHPWPTIFLPTQPPGVPDAAWKLEEGCCAAGEGVAPIHQVIECDLEPQHLHFDYVEHGFEVWWWWWCLLPPVAPAGVRKAGAFAESKWGWGKTLTDSTPKTILQPSP